MHAIMSIFNEDSHQAHAESASSPFASARDSGPIRTKCRWRVGDEYIGADGPRAFVKNRRTAETNLAWFTWDRYLRFASDCVFGGDLDCRQYQ
jgi:hypothetical protein